MKEFGKVLLYLLSGMAIIALLFIVFLFPAILACSLHNPWFLLLYIATIGSFLGFYIYIEDF